MNLPSALGQTKSRECFKSLNRCKLHFTERTIKDHQFTQ